MALDKLIKNGRAKGYELISQNLLNNMLEHISHQISIIILELLKLKGIPYQISIIIFTHYDAFSRSIHVAANDLK